MPGWERKATIFLLKISVQTRFKFMNNSGIINGNTVAQDMNITNSVSESTAFKT